MTPERSNDTRAAASDIPAPGATAETAPAAERGGEAILRLLPDRRGDDPAPGPAPALVDGVALARLYGEPLFDLPQDLYIPPDALEVFLEAFEGPLDLLLYLIRRQHFNVLDIPMATLTQQYLAYIEQIRTHNLELAAEYLLMAALLIEIKSRMLLPVRKADTGEEVEDPRAELVRRLVEYERIKLAALRLDEQPRIGRDFLRAVIALEPTALPRHPEVAISELQAAWNDILRRSKLHTHHRVARGELSVREHMSLILRQLQGTRFVEFADLFDPRLGTPVVVVHFLALLELTREGLVEITQAAPYAPMYVRLAYVDALN